MLQIAVSAMVSEERNELCFFFFRYLKGSVLQGNGMTYFVSDWLTSSYFHLECIYFHSE